MTNNDSLLRDKNLDPVNFEVFCNYVFEILPIRTKTLESYKSAFKCHMQGPLSGKSIDEVTRENILSILANLSPQTRAKVLAISKTIFREAIDLNLITFAPTSGIRNPILNIAPRKFLTWDELKNENFGAYTNHIRFLALHGLRWGEAVALRSSDVRDNRVYVNKSIHGETKTRSGNRVVPLVGPFEPFPRSPKTLRKVLSPYGVHIHSLRHTYAHILKTSGIHVSTAQRLMGHSSPNVTLAVYTRVFDREVDDSGEILRQLLN